MHLIEKWHCSLWKYCKADLFHEGIHEIWIVSHKLEYYSECLVVRSDSCLSLPFYHIFFCYEMHLLLQISFLFQDTTSTASDHTTTTEATTTTTVSKALVSSLGTCALFHLARVEVRYMNLCGERRSVAVDRLGFLESCFLECSSVCAACC